MSNATPSRRWRWAFMACLAAIVIAAAGWVYYRSEADRIRREKSNELAAVGRMKVAQISRWRQEREMDVLALSSAPTIRRAVARFVEHPEDSAARSDLLERLNIERESRVYSQALLVGKDARVLLSVPESPDVSDNALRDIVAESFASSAPVMSDLHRPSSGVIHLDLAVAMRDDAGRPVAAVVLTTNASEFLYPMIQTWPTSSRTAETLLVRRDGAAALYLNDLRHRKDAALSFRIPLSSRDVPAVQAVLGYSGILQGTDYRGVAVLADVQPIPLTAWHIEAKEDADEILAEVTYRAAATFVVAVMLIVSFAGTTAYLYRTRQSLERKQAAESLRESEEQYRGLFEHMAEGCVYCRMISEDGKPADFVLLAVNASFERLTGLKYASGRRISEVIPGLGESDPKLFEICGRVASTRVPEKFEVYVQALGMWLGASVYSPSPGHFVAVFDVIDERKRVEAALSQSEKRYRTLFSTMTEGFALHEMICDAQGRPFDYRFLDLNPAFEAMMRLRREDVVGRTMREVLPDEDPFWIETYGRVTETGEPAHIEHYSPALKRHYEVYSYRTAPGRFAVVFMDITERKKMEEDLRRYNEELNRFSYTVSHDLKSPLVTIRTFLGYLEKDMANGAPERVASDLGHMRRAAEKMGLLLDELLELSRVGRKTAPEEDVTLQQATREALELVAGPVAAKGVRVEVTEEPVVLRGDRRRLVEVFQNLLDNAVKFMGDQPAPRVEVGVEEKDGQIVLFVRDNGMGIDPRHQSKLFGLFEKLHPGTEGTGIGLALVKRVIEVHGGRVWAESEGPGKGATFRFTLAHARRS